MSDEAYPQGPADNVLDYFNAKQTRDPQRAPSGLVVPLVLIGGTALFVASATPTRTLGATRSTRLEWEQRAAEVDQAVTLSSFEKRHD